MDNETDRAEFFQSLKAFLIPASLFVATLITSAGVFLVYSGYSLGYAFLMASGAIMTAAFVAFFRFHNKLRAAGQFRQEQEDAS